MTRPRPLDYTETPPDRWRALTLHGPWDFPIAVDPGPDKPAPKRTENRPWSTRWRAPVLIHAGIGWDDAGGKDPTMRGFWRAVMGPTFPLRQDLWYRWARHVVAVATITDCHPSSPTCCKPWGFHAPGNHHLTLDHVRPLLDLTTLVRGGSLADPHPDLRVPGMPALWKPALDIVERIRPHIPEASRG